MSEMKELKKNHAAWMRKVALLEWSDRDLASQNFFSFSTLTPPSTQMIVIYFAVDLASAC